jgi:hypothetical protein
MPPILPYDYQTVDKEPVHDPRLTDLAIIGVPAQYRTQRPVYEAYPTKFLPGAFSVWELMLDSKEYGVKSSGQTIDGAWHNAIQLFLAMCADLNVSPFADNTEIPATEYVNYVARKYRIMLKRYVDSTRLLVDKLKVRVAYREYVRTSTGLIISSWAEMFPYTTQTRAEFESDLTDIKGPRFLRYVNNHFVHVVVPDLQIWVKPINMYRIQMGFTIEVRDGTINIIGNKTPTRKEVDAYIDRQIWLPLLRQQRFDGNLSRLF